MNKQIEDLIDAIGQVLLGKNHQVKLALACLFARGHLLIEDLPGMGKTTLAQCLAKVLGLHYERIQFTSDLLPADILGVSIFDQNTSEFRFHKGPIFSQVLLADEINRSTPKSQSALLEAMEEKQVTIEGSTRQLPKPFFVIATQNPLSQAGTYPLPESQLDRFLLRISLGYPSRAAEKMLFKGVDPRQRLADMQPIITLPQLDAIQTHIDTIQATDSVLDYLQRLMDFTRYDSSFSYGISPRGALALLKSAKAWAFIHNRDHVVPEDIQAVLEPVVGHRIRGTGAGASGAGSLSDYLVKNVDVVNS
ncbi:MoxR family ATPase [Saccharophagus degradans]|uniref:AAA family ATPase n=1 Tax=Saccharophagus degradans TaxID=86304 RepID=UPI0024782A78|nr:MoxR family ATPase [Saccharophagus degradans]WGP00434.1 MoxR family ATPase [Saccharophagus degradans]